MDGISNIAGKRTQSLKVGDKTYTLTPQVLAEYAEREAYILSLKPDPMDVLALLPDTLSDEQRERLEERAWKDATKGRFITLAEDSAFDESLHGIGWRLWRALRQHHPEIDGVQAALDLMEQAGSDRLQEITGKLDATEDKASVGNSGSPGTPGDNGQPTAADATGESRGHKSTEDSATATAGHGTPSTE